MPASRFLKHSGRNWPNPVCSFYLPISTSRDDPVRMRTLWTHFNNTLQHTATHYKTLLNTATTHCNTMKNTATYYIQHTATTHYNTLQQHTATHCNTMKNTATYYIQHTATHCNTLQHTWFKSLTYARDPNSPNSTHCNTLHQHTATHCNTRNILDSNPWHTREIPTAPTPRRPTSKTCVDEFVIFSEPRNHDASMPHYRTTCIVSRDSAT